MHPCSHWTSSPCPARCRRTTAGRGCSARRAAGIPITSTLLQAAFDGWKQLEAETKRELFHASGLYLGREGQRADRERPAEAARLHGLDIRRVDVQEMAGRFPWFPECPTGWGFSRPRRACCGPRRASRRWRDRPRQGRERSGTGERVEERSPGRYRGRGRDGPGPVSRARKSVVTGAEQALAALSARVLEEYLRDEPVRATEAGSTGTTPRGRTSPSRARPRAGARSRRRWPSSGRCPRRASASRAAWTRR